MYKKKKAQNAGTHIIEALGEERCSPSKGPCDQSHQLS